MCKAVVADDLRRAEVLELGCVAARIGDQLDQMFGPLQVAVVVGTDIGDEIGWMTPTHPSTGDLNLLHGHSPASSPALHEWRA